MTPRVTVVHERFTEIGGSELVVRALADLWEGTRVVAPLVDPRGVPEGMAPPRVGSPALQRLYRAAGRSGTYAHLLPLLPLAMARLDLTGSDVVITSHHAFANRVRVPDGVPVLSYTHTPARWIWEPAMRRGEAGGRFGATALSAFAAAQRGPDHRAAQRVTALLANSTTVRERIRAWWGRDATVVPPPVDLRWFTPDAAVPREDFLLLAGRLVPYKRPEIAVAAADRLGLPLVVAGEGRSRAALEALAGPRTTFLGRVDDLTMRDLMRRCRALVFPGEEDFGMVPVEAQACGAPVVALGKGGACDTVLPGRTGLLYEEAGAHGLEGLVAALRELDTTTFDPADSCRNADRFSAPAFAGRVREAVAAALDGVPASRAQDRA